jgi:hypothetical protein
VVLILNCKRCSEIIRGLIGVGRHVVQLMSQVESRPSAINDVLNAGFPAGVCTAFSYFSGCQCEGNLQAGRTAGSHNPDHTSLCALKRRQHRSHPVASFLSSAVDLKY